MSGIPLLSTSSGARVICWSKDRVYSAAQYSAAVLALSQTLPQKKYVINDCRNNFNFLVSLGACMLRRQISLFPSNNTSHTRQTLKQEFEDLYCIADEDHIDDLEHIDCKFDDFSRGADAADIPLIPSEQVVAIAFTSGSTGTPKRYHKHWGWLTNECVAGSNGIGLPRSDFRDIVATVPCQHMYGFIAAAMLALYADCRLYTGQPLYPEDVRLALDSSPGPAMLVTTPVQLRTCVASNIKSGKLARILSSAAPLDVELAKRAESSFCVEVMEYYGSTETGAIAARRTATEQEWTTFSNIEVEKEERGFIVKAPYYNEPIFLSDRVDIRSPKRFVLHGRDTDMVKIGGKRGSIVELNAQLLAIEDVIDGTFLLLDESVSDREPRLTAFVVAPSLQQANIVAKLRERIDEVFLPRPLYIVDSLPRTASGKLPRQALMALLAKINDQSQSMIKKG